MDIFNRQTATRGEGVGYKAGMKGKGVVKEILWMTHGHQQQVGHCLLEGCGMGEREQTGENWDNCNWKTIKYLFKNMTLINSIMYCIYEIFYLHILKFKLCTKLKMHLP